MLQFFAQRSIYMNHYEIRNEKKTVFEVIWLLTRIQNVNEVIIFFFK